jgi:hypothetical protein
MHISHNRKLTAHLTIMHKAIEQHTRDTKIERRHQLETYVSKSLGRRVTSIEACVAMRLKRRRGAALLARRLSHPVRQPGHTLTISSSVEPALIACLRWHSLTSECARERAARLDLLRLHRVSASICPRVPRPLASLSTLYSQIEPTDAFGPSSPPSSSGPSVRADAQDHPKCPPTPTHPPI